MSSAESIREQSITHRLATGIIVTVLAVSLVALAAMYLAVSYSTKKDLEQKADEISAYLVGALESPLWSLSEKEIEMTANAVYQDESVARLVIRDDRGVILLSREKQGQGNLTTRSRNILHRRGKHEIRVGQVDVALTRATYTRAKQSLLVSSTLIILLILVAVVAVTSHLIRTTLRHPLDTLSKIAERYALGIYESEGHLLPYREFQPFGEVLAQMATRIHEQMRAVLEAEARYRGIFENATEGIFQTTIDGRYLIANPAMARILGYGSPAELISDMRDIPHQLYVHPEEREKLLAALYATERISHYEVRFRRRDQQEIWALLDARLVRDEGGTPLFIEGVLNDITARKCAQEELKRAYRHLEQKVEERTAELRSAKEAAESANRAKSTFLSNMNHELRTPLTVILGYSELLKRDRALQPKQREYLNIIGRSGDHLLELINSVLELSKIETGHVSVDAVTFDLPLLLADLHAMFRAKAEAKNLCFVTPGTDGLPRHLVADENKLRQILINTLGNAIKFTESGSVSLRVWIEGQADGGMRLVAEVEDTGPGIAPEELESVFGLFEQTASGRLSKGGSGLGMAISRDYARLMGGDLTVASDPEQGSVFRLEIPVEEAGILDREPGEPTLRVAILKQGQDIPRILVAEDSEANRLLLLGLLQQAGFDARGAANGQEAVELFREFHPDFIWMDIRMPVMDGIEAARLIRGSEGGEAVTIVALTASCLADEHTGILASGFDELVLKPYHTRDIFDVMSRHLDVEYLHEDETAGESAGSSHPVTFEVS